MEYQPRHHRGEVLVESLKKLFPEVELQACLRFDASFELHRSYCSTRRIPLREMVSLFLYQDDESGTSQTGIILGRGNLQIGIGLPGTERSRNLLEVRI